MPACLGRWHLQNIAFSFPSISWHINIHHMARQSITDALHFYTPVVWANSAYICCCQTALSSELWLTRAAKTGLCQNPRIRMMGQPIQWVSSDKIIMKNWIRTSCSLHALFFPPSGILTQPSRRQWRGFWMSNSRSGVEQPPFKSWLLAKVDKSGPPWSIKPVFQSQDAAPPPHFHFQMNSNWNSPQLQLLLGKSWK